MPLIRLALISSSFKMGSPPINRLEVLNYSLCLAIKSSDFASEVRRQQSDLANISFKHGKRMIADREPVASRYDFAESTPVDNIHEALDFTGKSGCYGLP